jgi:hypothetical protein
VLGVTVVEDLCVYVDRGLDFPPLVVLVVVITVDVSLLVVLLMVGGRFLL